MGLSLLALVHFAVKRLWIFLSVGLGYAPGIREEWRLWRIPVYTPCKEFPGS